MSNEPIQIRLATEADADAIAAFNIAMARETEGRALHPGTIRAGVIALLRDRAKGVYYLAERGGRVVGQMMVTTEWSDWRSGTFWWIQSVYVIPESRGAGVYRLMHEQVEREAREAGDVCGLRLYVDAENAPAQNVYERLGMARSNYVLYETDWTARS